MKNKNHNQAKSLVELLMAIAVIAVLAALLLMPRHARAQSATAQAGFANRWNELTNAASQVSTNIAADTTGLVLPNPGILTTNTAPNAGNIVFPIYRGRGMSFMVVGRGSGSGTNTLQTYGLDLTLDGSNWTSTEPLNFVVPTTGTNQQTTWTNILADKLDNAKYGCLTTISGATTGYNWTNQHIYWSAIP